MTEQIPMGSSIAIEAIVEMLARADNPQSRLFPPTELYSEGWMLRLLLSTAADGVDCLPVRPATGSRWYSEALLLSPFLKASRSPSNHLAEGQTHADAVVGHIASRGDTEAGLGLTRGARQLVILEAKMFSLLSRGTTRARSYDQAARNVACLAWTLYEARIHPSDMDSVAFYVFAPQEQLEREASFEDYVSSRSISEKVEARVAEYKCDPDRHRQLTCWLDESFSPLLNVVQLECVAWEDLLGRISDPARRDPLLEFYDRCLHYNRAGPSIR